MLMAEDKMPPKNRYSLRFASKAAPVKHAKIAVELRKATVTILPQVTSNQRKKEKKTPNGCLALPCRKFQYRKLSNYVHTVGPIRFEE